MEDESLPMPTHEEVLVCNEHTTEKEIILLWKRAVGDPNYFRIFSLVHAEKLSYQTCDKALKSLFDITQGQKGYTCTLSQSCLFPSIYVLLYVHRVQNSDCL